MLCSKYSAPYRYDMILKMASDGLGRILAKPGFDCENFVNKLALGGEEDLQDMRSKVRILEDDTAIALKKNVYKHYSQFIETAKEISILEGEMYQLSHMLTDQKSIMNSMMESSLTGDKVDTPDETDQGADEEDTQKNLAFLLEKVEGCSSVTEVPGRYLVHNGDLLELDPESFVQVQKVHVFLLNDSLMIATWLPHRRGPVKYRFQTLYELDSLAVVNARDVGNVKNAFKILMFPDTRMFQAEGPKDKRQWLDILEGTKKKKAALDKQRRESAAMAAQERNSSSSSVDPTNRKGRKRGKRKKEAFADDMDNERPSSTISVFETDLLHVDWLQELPEDLDVCIAQIDFEGAVDLVEKVNEYLECCPKGAAVREYRARIDHRIKQLTEALMHELQVSPEKSIRGGPRSARRAVTQLIRLGKSAQACDLFLKNRSAIIRYNLRQLKIEGATTLYVKRLCEMFFDNFTETGKEFLKAFPDHYGCFSAFVVWSKNELEDFVKIFASQVFVSKSNFTTVADCVYEARRYSLDLCDIGLELTFTLDKLMGQEVAKIIQDAGDHQMDAVQHRSVEDLWRPMNYQNIESLEKFEREMKELGIDDIHDFSYDSCFTRLTANTVQFTRSYATFCRDLLKLYNQEHHYLVTSAFVEILTAQLKHAEKSLASDELKNEREGIAVNAKFLMHSLLPVLKEKYEKTTEQDLNIHMAEKVYRRFQREVKTKIGKVI